MPRAGLAGGRIARPSRSARPPPRVWCRPGAASPRPLVIEPDPFGNSRPRTALGTLEPPSTTVLLSAEQDKARLRKIVEGFFFRWLKVEDGEHVRQMLGKFPAERIRTTCGKSPRTAGQSALKAAEALESFTQRYEIS
jgi:hypothetical protein